MDKFSDLIGIIGVGLLLIAYILNTIKILNRNDYAYILLNFTGATIAGIASLLIDYMPFIILEFFWALVALIAFMRKFNNPSKIR